MMGAMDAHHLAVRTTFRSARSALYAACGRRRDALFQLCDTLVTSGSVASFPGLSRQPQPQRGWGSLYDARAAGEVGAATMEQLLAAQPLAHGEPIYAVDASVWMRSDAETSPGRAI